MVSWDEMDPCYQPHIFEPTVLARVNYRFTIRVTPSMVQELKGVITFMIEERIDGCPSRGTRGGFERILEIHGEAHANETQENKHERRW